MDVQQKSSKRQAKGPETLLTTDQDCEHNERQVKISRGVLTTDHQETPSIPSFSVQIVQQFNTSNTCQNPHQTIHTNVTVKALTGTVNSSSSPLTNSVSTNGADISVGTNVECKQEKESEDTNSGHPNGVIDRFPDTFPNLVFPEDSADDVLHPDLFNRLIDDVFTNSTDLMKDFNFGDAVSKDSEEVDKTLECVDTGVSPNTTTSSQIQFPPTPPMISPFSGSQSASPLFDTSNPVMTTTPSYPPRVPSYSHSSPLGINAGLGLDFKLTEPSPAAQTLKQMAEQHQSMQQKQQQLGLGLSSPHSRSPFGTDTFSDPLSLPSMRSGFMNGAAPHLSPLQKSPTGSLFSTMGYVPPTDFHCIRTQPTTGVMYKPENNDNLFVGMENIGHMPDVGIHKRQVMLLPRIGPDGKQNPNYSPEQKSQYGGTRPLSHFTDSMSGGNGPPPMSAQYPNTQRPPSGPTLQMSQSQQINQSSPMQMNPTGHSQPMTTAQQYPGYSQTPGSPSAGTFQITMSQSQSMSFSSPFGNRTPATGGGMTNVQQTPPQMIPHTQTDGMYLSRPPPDYKLQTIGDVGHHVMPNYGSVGRNRVAGASSQVQRQVGSYRRAEEPILTQGGGYLGKALGPNLTETPLVSAEKSTFSNSPLKIQRSPNVNVGPDGLNISQRSSSSEWRPQLLQCPPRLPPAQYSQSYANDLSRGMNSPQSTDKMQRYPNSQVMMQQHQQMALQGNAAVNMQMSQSISMTAGVQMPNQVYPQTASTPQDGSQINIEFFDNIESSATDLLNFETESANSHFSLLDDIGRLGK